MECLLDALEYFVVTLSADKLGQLPEATLKFTLHYLALSYDVTAVMTQPMALIHETMSSGLIGRI